MPAACLVFPGDHPDPTIVRHGDTWYCTHSSFRQAPGLTIWRSTDLVNWSWCGSALPDGGLDVWAPDLAVHAGRWFIYFQGSGRNRVIHADRPEGPWSAPIELAVGSLDPGHVVDRDGQRWLMLAGGWLAPLSDDGLRVTAEARIVLEAWPIPEAWRVEGVYLEGPKLWWQDGWCHLLTAQGGTAGPATGHMVLHARARGPQGPWQWNPHGPIARTTDPSHPWWSIGHASLVDGTRLLMHGYRRGFHTLGRQSLLVPVTWDAAGWLLPIPGPLTTEGPPPRTWSDRFAGGLGQHWRMWDRFDHARVACTDGLLLTAAGDAAKRSPPLTIAACHEAYTVETELDLPPPGVRAGLCLWYHDDCFLALTVGDGEITMTDRFWSPGIGQLPPGRRVRLRLFNDRHEVIPAFAIDDGPWRQLPATRDTSGYNHQNFGGFLSLRPGLIAHGTGTARFTRFDYLSVA
jgi:xylan 1,4-beta-xylosidase